MSKLESTPGTAIALAAGRGQRFLDAGYKLPKPIIPVLGRPCIEWAVESFPQLENMIIVLNGNHVASHKLDKVIQEKYPEARVVVFPQPEGQAIDAVKSSKYVKDNEPLFIGPCDATMVWKKADYAKMVEEGD